MRVLMRDVIASSPIFQSTLGCADVKQALRGCDLRSYRFTMKPRVRRLSISTGPVVAVPGTSCCFLDSKSTTRQNHGPTRWRAATIRISFQVEGNRCRFSSKEPLAFLR